MAKFPSQRKLMYVQENGVSNDGWTSAQSGGTAGDWNIPKDLSILNRRGYASTTRKGVPLVYRCKVDLFATNYDGTGTTAAVGSDFVTTLQVRGAQNNWVMRNAAVKWHAALQSMRKKAGIKRKQIGAYAHEIRYNFDGNGDTWITPVDGDGAAFAGGTWDATQFADEQDSAYSLKLVGLGIDEDTAAGLTSMQIGLSYLQSRSQVPSDSNLESDETPAEHSHLLRLLSPNTENVLTDEITDFTQGQGDNPPYDEVTTEDVNHDITEPVELGRVLVGPGAQHSSMIIDVPFGLAGVSLQHYDAADTNTTHNPMWTCEVLDIFEMQG